MGQSACSASATCCRDNVGEDSQADEVAKLVLEGGVPLLGEDDAASTAGTGRAAERKGSRQGTSFTAIRAVAKMRYRTSQPVPAAQAPSEGNATTTSPAARRGVRKGTLAAARPSMTLAQTTQQTTQQPPAHGQGSSTLAQTTQQPAHGQGSSSDDEGGEGGEACRSRNFAPEEMSLPLSSHARRSRAASPATPRPDLERAEPTQQVMRTSSLKAAVTAARFQARLNLGSKPSKSQEPEAHICEGSANVPAAAQPSHGEGSTSTVEPSDDEAREGVEAFRSSDLLAPEDASLPLSSHARWRSTASPTAAVEPQHLSVQSGATSLSAAAGGGAPADAAPAEHAHGAAEVDVDCAVQATPRPDSEPARHAGSAWAVTPRPELELLEPAQQCETERQPRPKSSLKAAAAAALFQSRLSLAPKTSESSEPGAAHDNEGHEGRPAALAAAQAAEEPAGVARGAAVADEPTATAACEDDKKQKVRSASRRAARGSKFSSEPPLVLAQVGGRLCLKTEEAGEAAATPPNKWASEPPRTLGSLSKAKAACPSEGSAGSTREPSARVDSEGALGKVVASLTPSKTAVKQGTSRSRPTRVSEEAEEGRGHDEQRTGRSASRQGGSKGKAQRAEEQAQRAESKSEKAQHAEAPQSRHGSKEKDRRTEGPRSKQGSNE